MKGLSKKGILELYYHHLPVGFFSNQFNRGNQEPSLKLFSKKRGGGVPFNDLGFLAAYCIKQGHLVYKRALTHNPELIYKLGVKGIYPIVTKIVHSKTKKGE